MVVFLKQFASGVMQYNVVLAVKTDLPLRQ